MLKNKNGSDIWMYYECEETFGCIPNGTSFQSMQARAFEGMFIMQ